MNNTKSLEELFWELDKPSEMTPQKLSDYNKNLEQKKFEALTRENKRKEREEQMKSLPQKRFVLGQDEISFRTSSWCYDTCGTQLVSFKAVARDDEYIYFWNLGKIEWHQSEDVGISHSNPFFKMKLENDNQNWWHEDNFIWIAEEDWKDTAELFIKTAVLPQTEYFDYLFNYIENKN